MKLNINKHLFAAYCGMIKSGYDLMDLSDEIVANVCNWIAGTNFDEETLKYFRFAKTNTVPVNPYYPRGSDLSAACFFQEKSLDKYVEFLRLCESPEADNPQFVQWVSQLPHVLARIENCGAFEDIYLYYRDSLVERFRDVPKQMADIEEILTEKPFCVRPSVVFAPNLLQSKFLADYALVEDTLYVISGIFRNSAVIHEYLHLALKPVRGMLFDIVQRHEIERYVDVKCMLELGYLRGESIEDKAHTLDECLVRALCGVIDKTLDLNEYCQENVRSGFHSVPQMINNITGNLWIDDSLGNVILHMIDILE